MKNSPELLFKILNGFTSNDPYRKALHYPFIQEEFVFATDAMIVMWCNKSLLGNYTLEQPEKHPDALGVILNVNTLSISFTTAELKNHLKCTDCNGLGYVNYEFTDMYRKTHRQEHDCPTCDTTGKVQSTINLQTGNRVPDEAINTLKCNDFLMDIKYVEKIVNAAELLEIDTISITNFHHGKIKFVLEDINFVLMQVIVNEEKEIAITPITKPQ